MLIHPKVRRLLCKNFLDPTVRLLCLNSTEVPSQTTDSFIDEALFVIAKFIHKACGCGGVDSNFPFDCKY